VAEILEQGRRQLASEGAAALSLRAIARELGMASSAVYRYVASRDDLLTLLIVDAYNSIGGAVERAVAGARDPHARWQAFCSSLRSWSLAHPHEYALIYGSPVPGYVGNDSTTAAAVRATTVLASILRESGDGRAARADGPPPAILDAEIAILLASPVFAAPDGSPAAIPASQLVRGLMAWTQLFGFISFELGGQFANSVTHPDVLFAHIVDLLAADIL
jgi:AcrR family transcriptional regulator